MSRSIALARPGWRGTATQRLTHVGLSVVPRRGALRWLLRVVLVTAALASGLGLGYAWREYAARPAVAPVDPSAREIALLRRQLDEARLGRRLSDARSGELERQIDALNRKLTEAQDELAFVRKAREGRR